MALDGLKIIGGPRCASAGSSRQHQSDDGANICEVALGLVPWLHRKWTSDT